VLPDGSSVELNGGSRVRYAPHFGDERAVSLYGEAFFDVAAETRPFIVETFNARIRVLGTRFNVRAWQGPYEEGTSVSLEAGRVELAPRAGTAQPVVMAPGETRLVRQAASYTLDQITPEDATAWRRGELVFKDQPLGVILRDVERRFALDIKLVPRALATVRLHLALREPRSAEDVVRDLALANGLRYRETATGFEMY
jgi:ferric-dicitrate binding protein FerR (iron transport regulator)